MKTSSKKHPSLVTDKPPCSETSESLNVQSIDEIALNTDWSFYLTWRMKYPFLVRKRTFLLYSIIVH